MAMKIFCDYCGEEITEERPDVFQSDIHVFDACPMRVRPLDFHRDKAMCTECFGVRVGTKDIRFTMSVAAPEEG